MTLLHRFLLLTACCMGTASLADQARLQKRYAKLRKREVRQARGGRFPAPVIFTTRNIRAQNHANSSTRRHKLYLLRIFNGFFPLPLVG
jgi:hypothetical protein